MSHSVLSGVQQQDQDQDRKYKTKTKTEACPRPVLS